MKTEFDFTVWFENDHNTLTRVVFETAGQTIGCTHYEAKACGLNWYLIETGSGEFQLHIQNEEQEPVTGRARIQFPWKDNEKGFTLIPGVYYNGNWHPYLNTATCLHMPERPRFRISLTAAASPHVLIWDGEESGRSIYFSQTSCAGANGAELDAGNETLCFSVPAGDDDCNGDRILPHYPYTWHHRDIVSCRFIARRFDAYGPEDLYAYYANNCRDTGYLPASNAFRAPVKETAALVRQWLLDKHYMETEDGKPILKNALTDFDSVHKIESLQEWNIIIGWCSGSMTALPLLAADGYARECALKYLDFLTTEGFSPSGIKMPVFDGHQWIDPRAGFCPSKGNQYQHVRFYGDYLYYLGRAILYESSNGISHPAWENDFAREIDILLELWERNKDFGMYWDIMEQTVRIIHPGTGAGAYALLALVQAWRNGIQRERTRKVLYEASEVYYRRCVRSGRCNAGPNDIREADDSESIAALTDAFTQEYEIFGERKFLEMAVKACNIFTTWVVAYIPDFPGGSPLHGINVCGGVIANTQNRHIGPGICTNSGRFIRKLAEYTNNDRLFKLYTQIKQTAYNCVCRYDGEFFSENFHDAFRKGMVTEQINYYDVYSKPGYAWCVSASWPATNILLSDFDDQIDNVRLE